MPIGIINHSEEDFTFEVPRVDGAGRTVREQDRTNGETGVIIRGAPKIDFVRILSHSGQRELIAAKALEGIVVPVETQIEEGVWKRMLQTLGVRDTLKSLTADGSISIYGATL